MKRVALILLAVLVLTGCNDTIPITNRDTSSDSNMLSSDFSQIDLKEITKYKGKKYYNDISLGTTFRVENEKNYYYCDEFGFYCVDKKSGEKSVLLEEPVLLMKSYKQKIYFEDTGKVTVFDTQTHQTTVKSYEQLFSLKIEEPQIRYKTDIIMVENGWLVSVWDSSMNTGEVYYTDSEFISKKQLPIERFDFVLDDEVFYFGDNSNVFCYNLSLNKHSYVTAFSDICNNEQNSNELFYLGHGKILVCRNGKIQIIDLVDCTSYLDTPYTANDSPSVVYDDDKMYLLIWESETSYRIDAISRDDKKIVTIFENSFDLPLLYCQLVGQDEQYLYLYNTGYDNEDGTQSGGFFQIQKNIN